MATASWPGGMATASGYSPVEAMTGRASIRGLSRPSGRCGSGRSSWTGKRSGRKGWKSDFDRLHSQSHDDAVFLYAFDLLELNGEDYRQHPLEKRKAKLEKILTRTQGMRFSEHLDGDGETIFEQVCKMGLEGIVSKRRDFPYRSGRCKSWVKIKNLASAAVLRIQDGSW